MTVPGATDGNLRRSISKWHKTAAEMGRPKGRRSPVESKIFRISPADSSSFWTATILSFDEHCLEKGQLEGEVLLPMSPNQGDGVRSTPQLRTGECFSSRKVPRFLPKRKTGFLINLPGLFH